MSFKKFAIAFLSLIYVVFSSGCACKHRYLGNTLVKPSCETFGIKTYTCDFCNDSYDEILPPVWHVTDGDEECLVCKAQVAEKLQFNTNESLGVCSVKFDAAHSEYLTKDLIIPSYHGVFPVTSVEDSGFINLAFQNLSIPYELKRIGKRAFKNNVGLFNVNALGVTDIGEEAFAECITMTSIKIYDLKRIDKNAFKNCKSLSFIYVYSSEDDFNRIVIEDGNEAFKNAQVIFTDAFGNQK